MKKLLLISFLVLSWTNTLLAKDLTDSAVENWINTFKEVKNWSKEHDFQAKPIDQDDNARPRLDSPFTDLLKTAKQHKEYNNFVNLLKKNGYSDSNEWAKTGDQIMAALMALELKGHQADLQSQMVKAQSELNNAGLTAEQKAMLESAMTMSGEVMKASSSASETDKAAVKKHIDSLKQVLNAP